MVAGDIVLREAVARRVAESKSDSQFVRDQRSRYRATDVTRAEIAERPDEAARPPVERGPGAGDVDHAAERVATEERALRSAHELDLIDVNQLDARRVRVELRHAVDVARDARVRRARADAAEAWVAQLARCEFVEEGVRRVHRRFADAADAGV